MSDFPLSPVTEVPHLDDVDVSGLADGDVLVWDAATSTWVVEAQSSGKSLVPLANGDPADPGYLFTPDGSGLFVEVDE